MTCYDAFRKSAGDGVAGARQKVTEARGKCARLVRALGEGDKHEDELVRSVRNAKDRIQLALLNLDDAERFARSKEDAWEALAKVFGACGPSRPRGATRARKRVKIIFGYWVYDVLVVSTRSRA